MSASEWLDFRDRAKWRRWLEESHSIEEGAWVIIHKKGSKREGLMYRRPSTRPSASGGSTAG